MTVRQRTEEAMVGSAPAPALREQTVEQAYRIGCPDVLEIIVDNMPSLSGEYTVSPEGRLDMAALDNPRVEGQTTSGLAELVALQLGLGAEDVHCRVKSYRSRVVFVYGPIEGGDRAMRYRGPESVVAFLRRCGGMTPGADVKDVHVIRGNVAQGKKPQVFTVNLEAILLNGDPRTNVLLQPFDEICIGERPGSKIGKSLPIWLMPLYQACCNLSPFACVHDSHRQIRDQEP